MDIRNDRQKGLNYTEIGKKYHLDPRTAKRYALSETKPAYQLSGPKASILDPYKHQIDQWLEEAPYSAVKILECCEATKRESIGPVELQRRSLMLRSH